MQISDRELPRSGSNKTAPIQSYTKLDKWLIYFGVVLYNEWNTYRCDQQSTNLNCLLLDRVFLPFPILVCIRENVYCDRLNYNYLK